MSSLCPERCDYSNIVDSLGDGEACDLRVNNSDVQMALLGAT